MPKITSIPQFASHFAKTWYGSDPSTYQHLADTLQESLEEHYEEIVGEGLTTRQAFSKVINQRAVHNKLGITSEKVRYYRWILKQGKRVKQSIVESILHTAGYSLTQERKWKII